MNPLLDPKNIGAALLFIFVMTLGGLAGGYEDDKLMEKNLCAHKPKPEYCGKEIK